MATQLRPSHPAVRRGDIVSRRRVICDVPRGLESYTRIMSTERPFIRPIVPVRVAEARAVPLAARPASERPSPVTRTSRARSAAHPMAYPAQFA